MVYASDITAVITNYNKPPEILDRCIRSIVDLGVGYILVDDFSENRSHIGRYENTILLDRNTGAYPAFLSGLNEVKTKYVMRVDADDYIIGIPNICGNYDAYISNTDNRATLDVEEFIKKPYSTISGAVVLTDVMLDIWGTELKYYGDILNYTRLINRYKCKIVDSFYVYDRDHSMITKLDRELRLKWINKAKILARKEINQRK